MPGAVRERDHVHPFGERTFRCSRGTDGAARLTAIRADTNGDSNERSIVRGFGRAARGTRRASLRVGVRRSTPGHARPLLTGVLTRQVEITGGAEAPIHVDAREPARRPVCRATRLLEHTYIKEGPGGGCRGHVTGETRTRDAVHVPGSSIVPGVDADDSLSALYDTIASRDQPPRSGPPAACRTCHRRSTPSSVVAA